MELTKWVERKFSFDFPPGLFPVFVERISGTPVRLENMLKGAGRELLTTRIGTSWSIQEHAGHLSDLEVLHDKRLDQFIAGMNILLPADMANKKTYLEDHNAKDIKDILHMFREGRASFIEKLIRLDDMVLIRTATHPRLNKEMRLVDMIYFIAEHDDHHLAIIRSLINHRT